MSNHEYRAEAAIIAAAADAIAQWDGPITPEVWEAWRAELPDLIAAIEAEGEPASAPMVVELEGDDWAELLRDEMLRAAGGGEMNWIMHARVTETARVKAMMEVNRLGHPLRSVGNLVLILRNDWRVRSTLGTPAELRTWLARDPAVFPDSYGMIFLLRDVAEALLLLITGKYESAR